MSWIFWAFVVLLLLFIVAVIVIGICWASDMDSALYRKYTTDDEYLDPYGNPVKGAKHGQ